MTTVLDPGHYAFNPYALPPLIVGMLILMLGMFVLTRDRPSSSNLSFLALCFLVAGWLLSFSMVFFSSYETTALWWVKVVNVGVPYIPAMVLCFALATLGKLRKMRTIVFCGLGVSVFFSMLAFTPWTMVKGVSRHFWGYYTVYTPVIWAFLIYLGAMLLAGFLVFYNEYRRCSGVKQKRLTIFLWSFGIGYLASVDFLPAMGIEIFPFGYLCVFVFVVMMGRGVWCYHSVDINSSFAAEQIIKTVADALLVIDQDGIVRVANEPANHLFANGASLVGNLMRTRGIPFFKKENIARLLCSGKPQYSEVTFHDHEKGDIVLEISTSVITERSGDGMAIVCIAKDVSERKRAENSLRKSEEQYRLLAHNISDLIWVMDPTLRYSFMSPSVVSFRGYTVEEAINQKAEETFTPESFQALMKVLAEEITKPAPEVGSEPVCETLELELFCKNKGTIWSETRLTFLRNSEGRLVEILGVARDISERRQALRALEESEDCYNDLIRQAQDAIMTLDRYGYIQGLNPAAERVLGYHAAELIGQHFAKAAILAPNSVAKTLQEFTLSILGWQRQPFDLQILRRDQTLLNMRTYARVIRRDKDHVKVQVVFREIQDEGGLPAALSA